MQIHDSFYMRGEISPAGHIKVENEVNAEKAATAFSALFIERMLNDIQTEASLFSNEKKTAGELMSIQMMNRAIAETIAENSQLKQTMQAYLEKNQK
ncbi:hypothetical protein [Photobacterium galatheae]|uniref:Flagellar protein FlgJ N-terminal domain-containing protein n=1 Tax=Photobacterium galatheae TaxID=1654360 RepID=A0A066RP15_9GAMM|nr:hypothetical protein [Photobacterium galatheae]KDM90861.1 hypothetical protein EA58_13960 [Photobacterium galatheae]MCM0149171.1 hypothetical protein [Photobacterium galatheae]